MTFPAVDTIFLGPDKLPGQWILQPGSKEFGWQVQQSWGMSGATVKAIGDHLAEPVFLVKFWNSADWDLFQPLRLKYLSKAVFTVAGSKTYAIGIYHPELAAIGVTSVVPKKVPWFTNNGKGLWTGIVEFIQYRKPVIVQESPDASIPAAAAPTPSASDALDAAGKLMTAQIKGSRG